MDFEKKPEKHIYTEKADEKEGYRTRDNEENITPSVSDFDSSSKKNQYKLNETIHPKLKTS